MIFGTQYYRPPFPESKYWKDDLRRMKDSGLNTVQFWLVWGWIEPKPGEFRFDDYDRLMELAQEAGLDVVLSTKSEIHPYWIHREVPGSEMIDHMGHRVISSGRGECHAGITPGGCTDHPVVWEKMRLFLETVGRRYGSAPHLRGWDCWNEIRWNVNADGLVCFCEHTLAAFRKWLSDKHGGLDGLNAAWKRRYGSFEDVWPGKLPGRLFTEMMAFEEFLTWRVNRHGKARYEVLKAITPHLPVVLHNPCPNGIMPLNMPTDHALNRGLDWQFAEDTDGIGFSCYPKVCAPDFAGMAMTVDFIRSASGTKRFWASELQGGGATVTRNVPSSGYGAVDAVSMQRWVWHCVAGGTAAVLFWAWRDEVFGGESGWIGIVGDDGLKEERLAALQEIGRALHEHRELLADYRPLPPEAGILFSPQSAYLFWAELGNTDRQKITLQGYSMALEQKSMACEIVEECRLDVLRNLKILFLPRVAVMDAKLEEGLEAFVRGGGTLFCESETGAFTPEGFFRYPEDRFIARLTGACEIGRRPLSPAVLEPTLDGVRYKLPATQWLTPWRVEKGEVWAGTKDAALLAEVPVGRGRVILCASYLGEGYDKERYADFENFLEILSRRAGRRFESEILDRPTSGDGGYVRCGKSGGRNLAFVFFPEGRDEIRVRFPGGYFGGLEAVELLSGKNLPLVHGPESDTVSLKAGPARVAVLATPGR